MATNSAEKWAEQEWTHAMVDLETGDTHPGHGFVFQVAAVKFNILTRKISHDFFDRCMLPATQPSRRFSEPTRAFWAKRPHVLASFEPRMEDTRKVLQDLYTWASGVDLVGKPTHFDFSFLQTLYAENGMQTPFHFRYARDMNSMIQGLYFPQTPPEWEKILPFEGDEHNALHDCLHQVKVLFKALDRTWPEAKPLEGATHAG